MARLHAEAEARAKREQFHADAIFAAFALGAFALHKRNPRAAVGVAKLGGAAIIASGAVQVGLAYVTAQWARFGAFLYAAMQENE